MKPEIKRILEAIIASDGEIEINGWNEDGPDCYTWTAPVMDENDYEIVEAQEVDITPYFNEMVEAGYLELRFTQTYDAWSVDILEGHEITITDAGKQALAAGEETQTTS